MANIPDSHYGKTSQGRSVATRAKTSALSSNPSQVSADATFQFLDLREGGVSGGGLVGNGWSVAWRTYDAQYWGVPQRRKRIYLVADFASERAPEILFECEGLHWYSEESGEAREGTAADAERGVGGSSVIGLTNRGTPTFDKTETLRAESHMALPCIAAFMGGQGAKARSIAFCDDGTTPTLKSSPSGGNTVPDICYALKGNFIDRDTKQNGVGWRDGVMYTLDATDRHAVALDCRNLVAIPELSSTLQAKSNGGQSLNYQNPVVYDARGNGDGNISPTLTGDHQNRVTDYTAICVGNGQMDNITMKPISNALDCMHDQQAVMYENSGRHHGIADTLDASYYKGTGARNGNEREVVATSSNIASRKYIIRRLTPLECCRLQGFPDWWEDGVDGSDSARYKMWGNGIALPCAVDVLGRIVKAIKKG